MNPQREATIWIGGEAGEGIASAGDILLKAVSRLGIGAFAHNSYQSVIRGGHVLLQIHLGPFPVLSQGGGWDFLIALDQKTLDLNLQSALPGAAVLFNGDAAAAPSSPGNATPRIVPVGALAGDLPKNPVMQNTVLLGALVFLLRLDWPVFETALRDQFGKRKAELAGINAALARRGWEYAQKNFPPAEHIALAGDGKKRMVMSGNQAIALGAVAGGCKFYAAYPMTPASSIMHWLAPRAPRYGMLMKQTEDEIAAINMAVGAGFAGVRSMVGTSGGGFALMTEALGMAGMVEAPVVVARAPYYATVEALNLAEQYQMPVIVLSDLYLSERNVTVDPESLNPAVPIERGETVFAVEGEYLRYRDTPSGISPRTLPGTPGGMHTATSDEHNPQTVLISDVFTNPSMRARMMEKRMRKMEGAARDTEGKGVVLEGRADADLTLVGWGSTYQVIQQARSLLESEGLAVNHLQIRTLWPFPVRKTLPVLEAARKTVCVENNYGGLLARLIRQETGFAIPHAVHKFDGEPFSAGALAGALKKCLPNDAPAVQTLVSTDLDIPAVLK
jgi:2-oxoglutarate ferredoxin oxidoreductase subunit alpha